MTNSTSAAGPNPALRRAPRKHDVEHEAPAVSVSLEQPNQMIAVVAYYRAERRGFSPGHELEDWLEAEAEIKQSPGYR